MKKPLPMKECYGSYGIDKKCARCTYRASCELYTATGKGIDSRMGLVSFDNTVEEWLDDFNVFSIYQVLPQIIQMWHMNTVTTSESKKKVNPPTGR